MKRSLQIRIGLIVLILLFSIVGLIPTFRSAAISPEEREAAKTDPVVKSRIDKIEAKAIRQGLDLQGGMYIVLEIEQEGMSAEQARDALQRVREIISNRIDQFGVSEPVIQIQGSSRIIVQLPGIQDPERARNLIGRTAQLEFRLVRTADDYETVLKKLDEAFVKGGTVSELDELEAAPGEESADVTAEATLAPDKEVDLAAADTTAATAEEGDLDEAFADLPPLPTPTGDTRDENDPYVKEHPFTAYTYLDAQMGRSFGTPLFVDEEQVPRIQAMLEAPEARVIPRNMELLFHTDAFDLQGGLKVRPLFLVNAQAGLKGDQLTSARSSPDSDRPGGWMVEMNLDRKGARQFSKLTGENVGRKLAICLDGKVASAPNIIQKIPSGQASITGSFTNEEASDLALLLRAGALPTEVHIEEERTVGPSLGHDSITQGIRAALYGALLVIVFILFYYRLTGAIVVLALISNIIILMAVLAQFGLVLTLPGIAGIILTVGMAVDANVLINERIREELRKDKTLRAAVDSGYANATRTIIDANVTTLIAAGILLWFGTGPIKGFAVTLSIGILTSMFTALVLTRVIMELWSRNRPNSRLSI